MGDKLAGAESQKMGDDGQTMGYKLAGKEKFFKGLFKGPPQKASIRVSSPKGLYQGVLPKRLHQGVPPKKPLSGCFPQKVT